MQWYNEPPNWQETEHLISVTSGPKTDFWRKTHYGFIRDDGHFYYQEVSGDFVAEVKVSGQYQDLYDQAGLMIRQDEITWLKCGIEFVEGIQCASVVITRDFSDWSVVQLPQNPAATWLKLKRQAEAIEVHYGLDGEHYTLLRLGYFSMAKTLQVGIMCASPEGNGFQTTFENFKIGN